MKMDRKLKIPGIYKHFKGKYYAVMGISVPTAKDEIEIYKKELYPFEMVKHTERDVYIEIYHNEEKNIYIHNCEISKDILIVYIRLYWDLYGLCDTFARPIGMFLSEVDREKYPDCKQKYRFEEI